MYDALNYASQVEDYTKEHRVKKDLEGAELMSSLINKLIMNNRMKELQDMTTDKELRECLYKEYGIK